VLAKLHSRRSPPSGNVWTCQRSNAQFASRMLRRDVSTRLVPNSHGIISFTDPHPLNSVVSYRYKIMGGEATISLRSFDFQLSTINLVPLNSFTCHTSENSPVSPAIATLPKTRVSNPCVCHTYSTTPGISLLRTGLPRNPPAVALVPFWNSSSTQHSSFFSTTYALPILQVLSFDVHPSNGGVYPPAYQLSTSKLHLSLVVK